MKRIVWMAVLVGIFLTACASQPASTTATMTIQPSSTPAVQLDAQPEAEPAAAPTATLPPLAAQMPEITPEQSYQTIAAVHANILLVESWLIQGISDNQREAMLTPIVEMSMRPLSSIFDVLKPPTEFTEPWQTAQDLHNRFYPQMMAWLVGDLADDLFAENLIALKTESNQLISTTDQIAYQEFGIEVAEYQPDYAIAMDIVFELSDQAAVGLTGNTPNHPWLQTELLTASPAVENQNLLVRDVTPLIYQFAGSDLLLVIGQVENIGAEPFELAEVEVLFYDVDNAYIGTMWGTTTTVLIEPGKTYPFSVSLVTDGDDTVIREQWLTYDVQVKAHPLSFEPAAYYHDFDIVLLNVTQTEPGEYLIEGSLTNLGPETVNSLEVFISATGFDTEGALVGVGSGIPIEERILAAGETIPFEIVIQTAGGEPVSFQFYAEALIVPE